jgi:asparagine synthetase A
VPIDPFSNKLIIYKKLDDNFTVYSYGPDFDDDGGVRRVDYDRHNGDIVVWPVEKCKEPTPKQQ